MLEREGCSTSEFIDHPIAFGANGGLSGCSRMRRDNQTHQGPGWRQGHGCTVIQRTLHAAFWMGADLIWSTLQSRLYLFQVE